MTECWIPGADESDFGLGALPYAVLEREAGQAYVAVRIGDRALDLTAATADHAKQLAPLFTQPSLDSLMAAGRDRWRQVRGLVADWLTDPAWSQRLKAHLTPLDERPRLPFTVADYVDFYASRTHAETVGAIFRPGADPLPPNWLHLPIGYHGRAGTVVVSGSDIVRPHGQRRTGDAPPEFGPTGKLDIEAEVGFVVGTPSQWGEPVAVDDFAEHVFGVVLVNDWSARDIQRWEGAPLGPFLGKSFATSISAWVLPLAALSTARVPAPRPAVPVLPYLRGENQRGLHLDLQVDLNGTVIARPPFESMYWTPAQMLAHMTANGASLRTGDLFASGTVSGPAPDQRGCLLERTTDGREEITLDDGSTRGYLADGDEVVITATAPGVAGRRIGLGEVRGRIVTART
ncbi:MAG: fumarylacetoacetase [Pseudonocardiales bacterium]|nr:fumarylacetoacetase [Pseudonocardiales bacterium]